MRSLAHAGGDRDVTCPALAGGRAHRMKVQMTTPTTVTPALAALAAVMWMSACGPQSATSPSPVVVEPSTTGYAISGVVLLVPASASGVLSRVDVTDGINAGASAVSTSDGRYVMGGLAPGEMTLVASADGYDSATTSLALSADRTTDFDLQARVLHLTATGRAVDVLTRLGLRDIGFVGPGVSGTPTDATGAFLMSTTDASPTSRRLVFRGTNVVERHTDVRMPGANTLISMIAGGFDLAAFDEMFRAPALTRWTVAPPLVLERSILQFTDVDMSEGSTLDDRMSSAETDALLADLKRALAPLTGGAFDEFSTVRIQTSAGGSVVELLNDGVITVGWVAGLQVATGYVGYGRWSPDADGAVTAGLIMLDSSFQRSRSPFLRSIRAHELGHALGYHHVTTTPSVMNAWAVLEPTAFDRDASRIAFDRQPGNRSPDIDPDAATTRRLNGIGRRWSAPHP
jgi:Carboxypeptidase regulatory-like domain